MGNFSISFSFEYFPEEVGDKGRRGECSRAGFLLPDDAMLGWISKCSVPLVMKCPDLNISMFVFTTACIKNALKLRASARDLHYKLKPLEEVRENYVQSPSEISWRFK